MCNLKSLGEIVIWKSEFSIFFCFYWKSQVKLFFWKSQVKKMNSEWDIMMPPPPASAPELYAGVPQPNRFQSKHTLSLQTFCRNYSELWWEMQRIGRCKSTGNNCSSEFEIVAFCGWFLFVFVPVRMKFRLLTHCLLFLTCNWPRFLVVNLVIKKMTRDEKEQLCDWNWKTLCAIV